MLARSRFRTRARGPGAGSGSGGGGTLTALAQILALEPTALWWPTEGSGWQGRTGGDLSAVGSPVGILPDLSELGGATLDEWLAAPTTAELVTNGDFSDGTTGWTAASTPGTLSLSSNKLRITADGAASCSAVTTLSGLSIGKSYLLLYDIDPSGIGSGAARFRVETSADLSLGNGPVNTAYTVGSGAQTGVQVLFIATASTMYCGARLTAVVGGNYAELDNISVRELPGIHAIAPTDAARPLLGRVPVTGRRNLLLQTETYTGWLVPPRNAVTGIDDPFGGTKAVTVKSDANNQIVYRPSNYPAQGLGVICNNSVYIRRRLGTGNVTMSGPNNSTVVLGVTSEWQRFTLTSTTADSGATSGFFIILLATSGDEIDIAFPQAELGSTASDYQRVVTALDVTEAGVADSEYLLLDKVDDVLNATMPATTGKMVLATPEGTAVYGVNISAGSYDVGGRGGDYFPGTSLVGQTVGDFTDEEAASIATIFRAAGGGSDYGAVTNFSSFWRNWTELTSFPVVDTSSGTTFTGAWQSCTSLTAFPVLDVSSGTNFQNAWQSCTSLTTFPLLDVSSGTTFTGAWFNCTSLTSFPLLDVSSGTTFAYAWLGCSSLTTFPLLDVSSGTIFQQAWQNCTSLTTFPLLDVSSGTNFFQAWQGCNSLTTFPANMFDTVTATDFTNAFISTNLSQTSIDNILTSINTAGTSGGTFNQSGGSAPSATGEAAIDALRGRGWTVTVTGGY